MNLFVTAEADYHASIGADLVKEAGKATATYSLSGKLYLSKDGWLLLSVPNAIARGAFDAMDEPGIELPPYDNNNAFNAHISVMRPAEVEQAGGASKITERGHSFHYNIGRLKEVAPKGWKGISKCWFLHVTSPELMRLRKSYGLPPLPVRNGESMPFHITVAVRRHSVLYDNEVSKVSNYVNGVTGNGQTREISATDRRSVANGGVGRCGLSVLQAGSIKGARSLVSAGNDSLARSATTGQSGIKGASNSDRTAVTGRDQSDAGIIQELQAARKDTEVNPTQAQQEAGLLSQFMSPSRQGEADACVPCSPVLDYSACQVRDDFG